MKIALIINHFQPKIGYHDFFLARALGDLGHTVRVFTSEYYFPFVNYSQTMRPILGPRKHQVGTKTERGVRTTRLPAKFLLPGGMAGWLSGLKDEVLKFSPDYVIVNGLFSPLTYQAARLQNELSAPFVFDTHASHFNTKLNDTLPKKLYISFFKRIFVPTIKQSATHYTAVGTSEASLLQEIYDLNQRDIAIILLGADTKLFKPDAQARKLVRSRHKISQKDTIFIHAGKLTPEKDIDILLQGYITFSKRRKKVDHALVLIGNSSQEYEEIISSLTAQVANLGRVVRLPAMSQKKLARYYAAADIGVWPGNLSNTIQEAMGTGLKVILPKWITKGQSSDHLQVTGFTRQFKRGNSAELAKKMKELVGKKGTRQIRSFAVKNLDWKYNAEQFLDLYYSAKNS